MNKLVKFALTRKHDVDRLSRLGQLINFRLKN